MVLQWSLVWRLLLAAKDLVSCGIAGKKVVQSGKRVKGPWMQGSRSNAAPSERGGMGAVVPYQSPDVQL